MTREYLQRDGLRTRGLVYTRRRTNRHGLVDHYSCLSIWKLCVLKANAAVPEGYATRFGQNLVSSGHNPPAIASPYARPPWLPRHLGVPLSEAELLELYGNRDVCVLPPSGSWVLVWAMRGKLVDALWTRSRARRLVDTTSRANPPPHHKLPLSIGGFEEQAPVQVA